jgi:hypothetical protein
VQAILKWLAGALATVYAKDGWVAAAALGALALVAIVVVWWLFGEQVLALLGA